MNRRIGILAVVLAFSCGQRETPAPGTDERATESPSVFVPRGPTTTVQLMPGQATTIEHRLESGAMSSLRLNVPAQAVLRPMELTIHRIENAPWGNVGPAFEIGPTGTEFETPVRIEFDLSGIELPPGVRPESLKVATVAGNRWVPLKVESVPMRMGGVTPPVVSAELTHLSPYGLVADPLEVSGVRHRFAANGIVAEFADTVYARLFVAPTMVRMYVDGGTVPSTTLTLSGLPTDDSHVLYLDPGRVAREIGPADGGSVTIPFDLTTPRLAWVQSYFGTMTIGGLDSQCAPPLGVWSEAASTCTLTADVSEGVVIGDHGVTLDCDGHTILPPAAYPGTGVGISSFDKDDVTIRECNIGEPGRAFSTGISLSVGTAAEIADCVVTDAVEGIILGSFDGAVVRENVIIGEAVTGILVTDVRITQPPGEPPPPPIPHEVYGNRIEVVEEWKSGAIELRGTPARFVKDALGEEAVPLAPTVVHDNVVTGGGNGVILTYVGNAQVYRNDLEGSARGVTIFEGGWPNVFRHNNVR